MADPTTGIVEGKGVDPNVKLPPGVAAAAAAADAIHKQAYSQPTSPQPDPPASPPEATAPAPSLAPPPAPPPAQSTEPQPQPPAPAPVVPQTQLPPSKAPAAESLSQEEWRHRYMAMEGRYRQATTSLGAMQEQLSEMGDELMRHQDALQRRQQPPQQAAPSVELSPEELQSYDPALISVMQKVARAAVMPDLRNVHNGVRQISQRVQQVSEKGVHQTLDEQVPNWAEINRDPAFVEWCRLPDVYSGQIRGKLLQAAFASGQAARVVAFFKGFLAEGQATGSLPDPTAPQPAPQPPRVPVVPLEMLATPGRAKPAGGDSAAAPADKPHFTRVQIKAFYDQVRNGAYAGRDQEKNALEQAIFLAQREGRVH